ncbi:MAG: copper amine oxidase N-terminal domain-containing protein, partial [Thermoanaerobacteraceae bacterium]
MKKIISFILMFALAFSTFITVYAKPDSKNHKGKATIENKEKESKVKQEEIKTQKQVKAKEKVEAKEQKEFKSKVKIKGVEVKFDVPPVIKDGHVLIPVRAITNGIGAKLDYDKDANIVTITKGDITIVFDFNTSKVYVNGKEVVLETEAEIINGRTLVPIRFI